MRERVWQVAIPFLFGKFFVRVTASKIPSGLLQRCVAFNLQNLQKINFINFQKNACNFRLNVLLYPSTADAVLEMADWSSGQDVALSRRKQGFDSPTNC